MPEVRLRRALHARGLRYRLDRRIGRFRPDVLFPASRTALFIDGCFWHGCPEHGVKDFRGPNAERWRSKLTANADRDRRASAELTALGWQVIRVWECEVKRDLGAVTDRVYDLVLAARS
ncbi:DNA mismatch endonuclease (patch repair protein) [Nocardioides zeae]|uniref:DNA mismatch endonuclease (Patch repair protein) n=1 Tax=Nocardioides zeae TaxID=1457234 RepID=A0ACC6IEH6_9ACTN|nr:DNA mismatch endonuclease (patch repair protein) [Nocardioides zeae]MDR6209099.1 DNA mismatch endonuclease (patch repair protein) [Nocardioides zeae]